MKKALVLFAFASLVAAQSFATYIVVLKDGKQYRAKAKWTTANGKALVQLESGQTLSIDPALIDEAKSDQTTKLGLGDVRIMNLDTPQMPNGAPPKPAQPSLGDTIRLRKLNQNNQPAQPAPVAPTPAPVSDANSTEILNKFERAYENIGVYEHKLTATGPHSLHAELTVDKEEKVFLAISATSFLMVHNAGISGAQIDMVELFMKTTNGGAAGRFQMSREDAQAIDAKTISQQDYFVRKVIY